MTLGIISELLKKPNVAFEKISQNPQYFRLAFVVFSISIFISSFQQVSTLIFHSSQDADALNIAYSIIGFGGIVLSHILMIVIIFYVGKTVKGNTNFKQVFSVLSFCLIPIMFGIAIIVSGNLLLTYSMSESTDDLSPSYALDFIVYPIVLLQIVLLPFGIWSLILYIKAIKITDDFSTLQATILVIFTIILIQLTGMLYSIGTSIPLQLLS